MSRLEPCLLLSLYTPKDEVDPFERTEEMKALIETRGGEVIELFTQKREHPDPGLYFGQGKIEEIRRYLENFHEITTVIVDAYLSPVQQRNLEEQFGRTVMDREELILEIFARHARTREARLQVELAELEYLLPRLRNLWPHLTGQQGGFNFRGPGETQLETDRRAITRRIAALKKKLLHIEKIRQTQRKGRASAFKVSIVGYTNAGKSSLLSLLSGKPLYVENKLFATLDTTVKKVYFPQAGEVLLSDTVGFIRNLPHHLVASFKSTLEELLYSDLILEVVDVASPSWRQKMEVVEQVLTELGAGEKPRMTAFNKCDLLEAGILESLREQYIGRDDVLFISVLKKDNIDTLKERLASRARISRNDTR